MNESKRLVELKRDFDSIYKRSLDKGALLEREIEGYSKIFDESKLKLPVLSKDDEPLIRYDIPYSSMRIFLIRQFYIHFIVKGSDLSEIDKDDWNSWVRDMYEFALDNLSESFGQKDYYYLTRDLKEYLKWLTSYPGTKTKHPDKYYAWYHGILIILSKKQNFPNNFTKKEIIEFGKNEYKTGEGFYKVITKLDLTQPQTFLNSMTNRDRAKWKKAIIDISNNDNDIINYLEKFPN